MADEATRQILRSLLHRAEAVYPDRSHRLWEVWEEALGGELAGRCAPAGMRGGRLTVAVSSPGWMQQLSFLAPRIRAALNRALGSDTVREIRFRIAEVPPPPQARRRAPPPRWLAEELPREVEQQIEEEVRTIREPDLRAQVRAVRLRAAQVRLFRERRAALQPDSSSGVPDRGGPGPDES